MPPLSEGTCFFLISFIFNKSLLLKVLHTFPFFSHCLPPPPPSLHHPLFVSIVYAYKHVSSLVDLSFPSTLPAFPLFIFFLQTRLIRKEGMKERHFILLSQEGNRDPVWYISELLLWSECFCSLSDFICWNSNPQRGEAFGRLLCLNLHKRICVLIEIQRACLSLPPSDGTARKCPL